MLLLRESFRGHRRPNVEADDHGIRGGRQHDVRLVDAADTGEHHRHFHLGVGDIEKGLFEGLYRASHVTLDYERQLLDLALFDAAIELLEPTRPAPALATSATMP